MRRGIARHAVHDRAPRSTIAGAPCFVTRSGYTGEDGFEISLPADDAERGRAKLLAEPEVKPIGLGARDSLRLEAGLCLYGHDIDETTTPIEAGLAWTIGKRRRAEGGFPGAAIDPAPARRGRAAQAGRHPPDGRAPAREGTAIVDIAGEPVGEVTSGGFGPSRRRADRHGLCRRRPCRRAAPRSTLVVRGMPVPAGSCRLPFVPHRYYRG